MRSTSVISSICYIYDISWYAYMDSLEASFASRMLSALDEDILADHNDGGGAEGFSCL